MTIATLERKTSVITSATQSQDAYALLNDALLRIEADSSDQTATFSGVQAYVMLGLIGPARELLSQGAPDKQSAEAKLLIDRLAFAPTGRVAWAVGQAKFESHLQKLLDSRPELRKHESNIRAARKGLELYRSQDGNFHLARRDSSGKLQWKYLLIDNQRIVADTALPHTPDMLICPPYIICHDRLGLLLSKFHAATKKMFLQFTPRLYWLTPDFDDLAAALQISDSIEHLCDTRVELLMGSDAVDQLAAVLRANPQRSTPEKLTCLPSLNSIQDAVTSSLRAVIAERTDQMQCDIGENSSRHERFEPAHWQARFADAARTPLRVLGITSRFTTVLQYSMRDLASAFRRAGHDFQILMDPSDHDVLPREMFASTIRSMQPDLIILIDHLRREFGESIPKSVPYVCWIQDMLQNLMSTQAGNSLAIHDFYIAPTLQQLVHTYHYPRSRGIQWTMVTNTELYEATPVEEALLQEYSCDFSYISNQSTLPHAFHARHRDSIASTAGRMICDHIFEKLLREFANSSAAPRAAMQILAEVRHETGIAPATDEIEDRLARNYIHPLSELLFRQSTMAWVADYCEAHGRTFHVYGRGWESHPRFAKYARGVADNGEMLRRIYQASRINLQINGYGAIHPRLLDGLASGGFFLIRDCPMDRIHTAAQELLEEIHTHRLELGCHDACHFPRLGEAWREIGWLRGATPTAGTAIRLTQEDIDYFQELKDSGYRRVAGAVFADYSRVAFASAEQFAERASHFLNENTCRGDIAEPMRQVVLRDFSYDGLVQATIKSIADRIGTPL